MSGLLLFSLTNPGHLFAVDRVLFNEHVTLEFSLEAPFQELSRYQEDELEVPAVLRYKDVDGKLISLNLEIKPRGRSRLRNCRFPPLRLNFTRVDTAGTLFEGQHKLKLTTHCKSTSQNRNYIAREYQVYRAYNLATDYSFKVRWASITYIDTDPSNKAFTEPGFLVEEDKAAADRLGMKTYEANELLVNELDQDQTTLMVVFQYLVGNIDWSALKGPPGETCCHNFKVLSHPGQSLSRIVLPYDFDQSSYVAADYAVHNEYHGVRPGEHPYKGFCELNTGIDNAVNRFNEIRPAWLGLIETEPAGYPAQRRQVRYLEKGFESLTDRKELERNILDQCRTTTGN